MSQSAWGDEDTRYFYELTPDRILTAVERVSGLRATGRCMALNSMENRVYDIEIDMEEEVRHRWERCRIAKFYRPGRWTKEQILEEHAFLADLVAQEVPVVAPLAFDGQTLFEDGDTGLFFTVFPKVGGRSPYELSNEQLPMIGRLLARLHGVGAAHKARHRIHLTPEVYGQRNLDYLLSAKAIPSDLESRYRAVTQELIERIAPLFQGVETMRIHGDCHLGNLLWGDSGPFWVDFDDFVVGPAVQDLWLMLPGRDEEAQEQMRQIVEAYQMLRDFDPSTLRLVEPLRALRFIHFSAWISKRWQDPSFPRAFPDFGTQRYWQGQIADLEEQVRLITAPHGFREEEY